MKKSLLSIVFIMSVLSVFAQSQQEKMRALAVFAHNMGLDASGIGVNTSPARLGKLLAEAEERLTALGLGCEVVYATDSYAAGAELAKLFLAELEKRGFVVDMETAKYKGERMIAVYLKDEIGGFAVHLLQK